MTFDPVLNVAAFRKNSRMEGPGVRDTIWLQGCTIGCLGCSNLAYWHHSPRKQIPVSWFLAHFRTRVGSIDGVSLSGGEPTEQAEAVSVLLSGVKALGFSTVCYTGRRYEEIRNSGTYRELLRQTDLLIDGPFLQSERDPNLYWRGSRNQRLIRLSHRFSEQDIESQEPVGEVILSKDSLVFHGVGVGDIVSALKRRRPNETGSSLKIIPNQRGLSQDDHKSIQSHSERSHIEHDEVNSQPMSPQSLQHL